MYIYLQEVKYSLSSLDQKFLAMVVYEKKNLDASERSASRLNFSIYFGIVPDIHIFSTVHMVNLTYC